MKQKMLQSLRTLLSLRSHLHPAHPQKSW